MSDKPDFHHTAHNPTEPQFTVGGLIVIVMTAGVLGLAMLACLMMGMI